MTDLKINAIGMSRVCQELGMSRSTVYVRMRTDPKFPRPRREGQRLKFELAAVKAYWQQLGKAG